MRIGLNCLRSAPGYRGGVNSFTFGLLDGFAASRRDYSFVLFAAPRNHEIFETYASKPNFRVVVIDEDDRQIGRGLFNRLPWQIRNRLPLYTVNRWISAKFVRQISDECDVAYVPYCPPSVFPFPDTPTVYSIHDIQHVHYPQFFTAEERLERQALFKSCVRHAALIQASSEQMLEDFVIHLPPLRRDDVVVIREGVDIQAYAHSPEADNVRERYGLPEAFLYFPAQLWYHKNHITVFKALARLKERGVKIPLVLSGASYSASQQLFDFIEQNDLKDLVFYLGVVPFKDVIALYHAARFLITAVLYESSSIPILEAAAAGTPIIASKTPANEERERDLQMQLFTPTDDKELAGVLERVWDDAALRERQVAHNLVAIQNFAWDKVAEDYLDAFEKLYASRRK